MCRCGRDDCSECFEVLDKYLFASGRAKGFPEPSEEEQITLANYIRRAAMKVQQGWTQVDYLTRSKSYPNVAVVSPEINLFNHRHNGLTLFNPDHSD